MKSKNLIAKILSFSLVLLSCGNIIDRQKNLSTEDRINDEMSKLPLPSQMPEGEFFLQSNPADPDYLPDEENYVYRKKQYYVVPELDTYFADDLPSHLLWPGAIIDSASFVNGKNNEVSSPNIVRAPLSISIDTGYSNDGNSISIENPNTENVQKAVSELIQRGGANLGASRKYSRYAYSKFRTKSEFETKLKTTVGFNNRASSLAFAEVSAKSSSSKKTKVIIEYAQCFFSIKTVMLTKSSDFFNLTETRWNDIVSVLGSTGTAPIFVSAVDYGRSIIAVIESDQEYESIKPGIEAFGLYLDGNMEENVQIAINSMKATSTITVNVLAEKKEGNSFFSFEDLITWSKNEEGKEFAKPIRYALRYLTTPLSITPARFIVGGIFYLCEPRLIESSWREFHPAYFGPGEYDEENRRVRITGSDFEFKEASCFRFPYGATSRISGEVENGVIGYVDNVDSDAPKVLTINSGEKFTIYIRSDSPMFYFVPYTRDECVLIDLRFECFVENI
jgi:hypothetical protein